MTETKIIHLNQNYSLRVEFDLETKDIHFSALFRSDLKTIENYGLDLIEIIDAYTDCENHLAVIENEEMMMTIVLDWIESLDIEALKAEHARQEAEERMEE